MIFRVLIFDYRESFEKREHLRIIQRCSLLSKIVRVKEVNKYQYDIRLKTKMIPYFYNPYLSNKNYHS